MLVSLRTASVESGNHASDAVRKLTTSYILVSDR